MTNSTTPIDPPQAVAEAPARSLAYARANEAHSRYILADADRTDAAIEGGAALSELKEAVPHGDFGGVLDELGINRRTARDWMRLHRFGIKTATVAVLGGLRATYAALSKVGKDDDHLWSWIAWDTVLTAARTVIETDSKRDLPETVKRLRQLEQWIRAELEDVQHAAKAVAAWRRRREGP